MRAKQLKVVVSDIAIGMYVCALDRPWEQTPFPVRGFTIREPTELKQLKAHCQFVFIDPDKGIVPDNLASADDRKGPHRVKLTPVKANSAVYAEVTPLPDEILRAEKVYQHLLSETDLMVNQAINDCLSSINRLKIVARDLVESMVGNPDGVMWLSQLGKNKEHPYQYLVRTAVWAVLMGRHLGLSRGELIILALGTLLKDIGKAQLAKTLLGQPAYQADFIEKGVHMLRSIPSVPPKLINIVKSHRERLNGSGIPQGLRGDEIFLLGKIVGLATFYEEVLRPYDSEYMLAPSQAVSYLYEARDSGFQADLVAEFIKATGLYATGTLVELSTGAIALVVEQNYQRRLKPKVIIVRDESGNEPKKISVFDLFEDEQRKKKLLDAGKRRSASTEKVDIVQDLSPAMYSIDLVGIREQWQKSLNKKSLFSFF